jgi:hypothetical protein
VQAPSKLTVFALAKQPLIAPSPAASFSVAVEHLAKGLWLASKSISTLFSLLVSCHLFTLHWLVLAVGATVLLPWLVVVIVFLLEPQAKKEDEDVTQFAGRVQDMISKQVSLMTGVQWCRVWGSVVNVS